MDRGGKEGGILTSYCFLFSFFFSPGKRSKVFTTRVERGGVFVVLFRGVNCRV